MNNKENPIFEKDLYIPIQQHFKKLGYEVHGEVKDCDITATKGDELVIIELKRNLSIKLLIQAVKRQKLTENVYIAIPKPNYNVFSKKWKDLCFLIRRLELGLITVSLKTNDKKVNVVQNPKSFDKKRSLSANKRKRKIVTNEIADRKSNYNEGGSTRTKLMTAYRENSIYIVCCLNKFGPLSPKQLRNIGTGDKTQSILSKNFYDWFKKIERGVYKLSPEGRDALKKYPELVNYYNEIINTTFPIQR